MKIDQNGLLIDEHVRHDPSPDRGGGIVPQYVVIHYTASGTQAGSDAWLTKRDEHYLSAHLTIGRDGAISQLVPFNTMAYHAGKSAWAGLQWMNKHSVGLELINWGKLSLRQSGAVPEYVSWSGKVVDPIEVEKAVHKNEAEPAYWQKFTLPQYDAAARVCALLYATYDIKNVIGHDDISPGRKVDPGPLFDWELFRTLIMTYRTA